MPKSPFEKEINAILSAVGSNFGQIAADIHHSNLPDDAKGKAIVQNSMVIAVDICRVMLATMNPAQETPDVLLKFMTSAAELYVKKKGN